MVFSSRSDVQSKEEQVSKMLIFGSWRLTQDICNLSTLCSNYKKLSPTVEFSPLQQQPINNIADEEDGTHERVAEYDADSILNLLKMWQTEGQFKHFKIHNFLSTIIKTQESMSEQKQDNNNNERLRIYANQLENVLSVLQALEQSTINYPDLQKLRYDIEIVKTNANWANIIADRADVKSNNEMLSTADCNTNNEDVNANAAIGEKEVN
ncbi:uncharacterized protein LOC128861770 [Anastrepha ludens]|uniref:uncharacterized protein LOC128861770 n=1 Tax=Anastrepha ludens TaxID=28586 RepID=UPI0023AF6AD4|nr:uncharacterized protein LOC128861770 [Anastrepha ludens]